MDSNPSDGTIYSRADTSKYNQEKIIQIWSHRLIRSMKFPKGDYSLRQLDTRLCQVDNKVNKNVIIIDIITDKYTNLL